MGWVGLSQFSVWKHEAPAWLSGLYSHLASDNQVFKPRSVLLQMEDNQWANLPCDTRIQEISFICWISERNS